MNQILIVKQVILQRFGRCKKQLSTDLFSLYSQNVFLAQWYHVTLQYHGLATMNIGFKAWHSSWRPGGCRKHLLLHLRILGCVVLLCEIMNKTYIKQG